MRTQNHETKTKMEDHTHFERQNILFIQLEEHLVLGNSKRTSKSIQHSVIIFEEEMPTDKAVGGSSGSAGKKRELVKFAPENSENNSR